MKWKNKQKTKKPILTGIRVETIWVMDASEEVNLKTGLKWLILYKFGAASQSYLGLSIKTCLTC